MYQNRRFNRTKIQLTGFYTIAIGLITLSCGYAIQLVMVRAFARTVDRELNTLAGTVNDSLESVLEQPEVVNQVAMNLLPGLCVIGKEYSIAKSDSKIAELTQKIDLRLKISIAQLLYLNSDSDRLYRSIANLINNAIQYTPDSGIVTISLAYLNNIAILTEFYARSRSNPEDEMPPMVNRSMIVVNNIKFY